MTTRLIYMTFPTREAALLVARDLIERRLAACANLIPGVTSLYRWQGKLVEDGEVVLVAKTTAEKITALREAALEKHPYTLPCIVAFHLDEEACHRPYLDWIATETA